MEAKRIYELRNFPGLKGTLSKALTFLYIKGRLPAAFKGRSKLFELWSKHGAPGGRVIALGSNYPPAFFEPLQAEEVIQIDLKPFEYVNVVADAERLTDYFEISSCDLVIATSMLEHTPQPDLVFKEVNKVLCHTGILYVEVPWMFPLHGEPRDYWRFSLECLKYLSEKNGFKMVDFGSVVSPHGALYTFLSFYLPEVLSFNSSILNYSLRYIFSFVLWPVGLLERIFRLSRNRSLFYTDSIIYALLRKA